MKAEDGNKCNLIWSRDFGTRFITGLSGSYNYQQTTKFIKLIIVEKILIVD